MEMFTLSLNGTVKKIQFQVQSINDQLSRINKQNSTENSRNPGVTQIGKSGNASWDDNSNLDASGNSRSELCSMDGESVSKIIPDPYPSTPRVIPRSIPDSYPCTPRVIPRPSPATPRTLVMHVNDFNRPRCSIKRIKARNVIRNKNGSVVTLQYHVTRITFKHSQRRNLQ